MITVETLELVDHTRPSWYGPGPRPIRTHVRRIDPTPRPLIVISHGAGGASPDLSWLAEALATAGFVAVTCDHHGNNHLDDYAIEAFARIWDRPTDLRFLIDHFTEAQDIPAVGVAGFSLGGYAAAALVGARIEPNRFAAVIHGHAPPPDTPDFPNLIADLRELLTDDDLARWTAEAGADHTDPRVGAALLMAPAVGPLIDETSLTKVDRPVTVFWGDADEVAPAPDNAHRYADLIPGATGTSVGADVEHQWFTTDTEEGAAVRARVAKDAVEFFGKHLG